MHNWNDRLLKPREAESYSRLLLRQQLLGSDSETMNFTLDDSGEWEKQKNYATVGSHVKANGEVLSPATFTDGTPATWTIKVESTCGSYKKEYDNVPTGTSVSFSIPTNFGDTTITLKVWSSRGATDAGVKGTIELSE